MPVYCRRHTRNRATAQPPRASVSPSIAMSNSRKSPYLPDLSNLRERDALKQIKLKIEQLIKSKQPVETWYQSIYNFCDEAKKGGNVDGSRACYKEDGEVWEFACTRMGVEKPAVLTWRTTFRTLCAQLHALFYEGDQQIVFFSPIPDTSGYFLMQAVRQQSALALQYLLRRGGDPNAFGHYPYDNFKQSITLLGKAAQGNSAYIVELLLDAGATVDRLAFGEPPMHRGPLRTPLGLASENGNVSIAQVLIDSRADVNVKDELEGTPLHYAAGQGNLAMVQLLVKNGANRNARDHLNRFPWRVAQEKLQDPKWERKQGSKEAAWKLRQMVIEAAGGPRQPLF